MFTCHCSFILAPLGCSQHSTGKTFYLLRFAINLVALGKEHYLKAEGIIFEPFVPPFAEGSLLLPLITYLKYHHCTVHQVVFGTDTLQDTLFKITSCSNLHGFIVIDSRKGSTRSTTVRQMSYHTN